MKGNRAWLLSLCLLLCLAAGGTFFVFAQGGAPPPGLSGEAGSLPISPAVLPAPAPGPGEITLGASGIELRGASLDRAEVFLGESVTVTLGASGCRSEGYLCEVRFEGEESKETLSARARGNPVGEELTLRIPLPVTGPADHYRLVSAVFTDGDGEASAFYAAGDARHGESDGLLPGECAFTAADPNGEFTFLLSDPGLPSKLEKLGGAAKATVLYGAKDRDNSLVPSEVFAAVRGSGKELRFDDGKALWSFSGGSVTAARALDLRIQSEYDLPKLEELVDWKTPYYAFRLPGGGELPGSAGIALEIGVMSRLAGGGLTLYRLDEEAGSLERISGGLSADDGWLRFRAARCGVYLLCKGEAAPLESSSQPEREKEYEPVDDGLTDWYAVRDRIDGAEAGAMVSVRIEAGEPIPYWIVRYLRGRDVLLSISDGSGSVTIDGLEVELPKREAVYQLDDLKELFS